MSVAVEAMFGPDFAASLSDLSRGAVRPDPLGFYGLHLVWVSERVSVGRVALKTVQQRVKDDWVYEQARCGNEAIFLKLLERYEVVVESPATAGGDGS